MLHKVRIFSTTKNITMKKKEEPKEEVQPNLVPPADVCGPEPKNPGTGAGDWQCKNGKWVWVENIG